MSEKMIYEILAAIAAMAVFCSGLIWWTLKRAADIQDKALDQWGVQNTTQKDMSDSLKSLCVSLNIHDKENGIAHRQAARILKGVAATQAETLKLVAGNKDSGVNMTNRAGGGVEDV